MTSDEYDEYDAKVRVPKGARLVRSRKTAGAHRGFTHESGDKKIVHAEIFLKDENGVDSPTDSQPVIISCECVSDSRSEEDEELDDLIRFLVLLGVIKAAEKAAPYVRRWWDDQALPFMKSTWSRLARTREADSEVVLAETPTLIEYAPVVIAQTHTESSQEVTAALEEYRASMTCTEARERFVLALIARLFSEEQMRLICNARIEDENGPLELENALETLTPKRVVDRINSMLELDPSLLDELGKILSGSRFDGKHL